MLWLWLSACGPETPDICDVEVQVTYADFGASFLRQHCNGCHSATTMDRHGAPTSVTFDSIEEIWQRSEDILRVTTSDTPTMPPAWDLDEGDVELLEHWLMCGTERKDRQSLRQFSP